MGGGMGGGMRGNDAGMTSLACALGNGALPRLQELYLGSHSIGDMGLSALTDVMSRGALASTRMLYQQAPIRG